MSQRKPTTHCKNGDLLTPENTYIDPKGTRACKICRRASIRRSQERAKERDRRVLEIVAQMTGN